MAHTMTELEWIEALEQLLATPHQGAAQSRSEAWEIPRDEDESWWRKYYADGDVFTLPSHFRSLVRLAFELGPESELAKRLKLIAMLKDLILELEPADALSEIAYDRENWATDKAQEKIKAWMA